MRVAFLALTTAALLGTTPAAAQAVVCRPNQLGTVSCPAGPRPAPRPEFDTPVQALERVREAPEGAPERGFIPARRTRGLGGVRPESDVIGPCRPDRLGNLHCR